MAHTGEISVKNMSYVVNPVFVRFAKIILFLTTFQLDHQLFSIRKDQYSITQPKPEWRL